jgi:hypothetical protein
LPIDVEARKPSDLEKNAIHFCDAICTDAYRRENRQYQAMSRRGSVAIKEYKEKHGKVHSSENRKASVSANNTKAPPKNKNFDRQGKAFGYDVHFEGTGQDYIVTVPDLPEIAEFHSKTMKAGLLAVRAKMLDIRAKQRKAE